MFEACCRLVVDSSLGNKTLVLVIKRLTMPQRQRRHQPWEMFYNLVNLAVKLWFYKLYTKDFEVSMTHRILPASRVIAR